MSTSLAVVEPAQNLPAALGPDLASAVDLAKAEKAPSTRKAYGIDFRIFRAWCDGKDVSSLPAAPETVAAFLAAQAGSGIKTSTIGRRVAAIRYAHKLAGVPTPTDAEAVKATVRGIRRTHGAAKVRKSPAVSAKVLAMVATAPGGLTGLRDTAILLLGFGGAFRRSELVALDVADIAETETGLLVTIRHSKTDQEAEGETIAVSRGDRACPVKALRAWLDAAGIETGPIFRPINKSGVVAASRLSDRSVANIVKAYAEQAGLDPAVFSGHSLRSGFLTSAAGNGASIFKMMDVSRQVGGHPAWVCPRCRIVQGSCRVWASLIKSANRATKIERENKSHAGVTPRGLFGTAAGGSVPSISGKIIRSACKCSSGH